MASLSSLPLGAPEPAADPLADEPWYVWLATVLPAVFSAPFAEHHCELWDWVFGIERGVRPVPFLAIWSRGGAKSSSAEAACVVLGARRVRNYGLYVCSSQEAADDHVSNVGSLLETDEVAAFYPLLAARAVGKYGNQRGWRRNRLSTHAGFTLDAIGLDTAVRGVKMDQARPDFIVVDDIDREHDSPETTAKKVATLTKALIPAGSPDLALLGIQNLVHPNSVFAQLADGRAQFLARRRVSGPIPAVRGLVTERRLEDGRPRDVVVAGEPTWEGQDLATCQSQIDDWGLTSFMQEAQHDVHKVEGTLWVPDQLAAVHVAEPPAGLERVVVAVDPSGGDKAGNDEQGIVVAGRFDSRRVVVLDDRTTKASPLGWARAAVLAWWDWEADEIVVETNFGGQMATETIRTAAELMLREGEIDAMPKVVDVTASQSKRVRAEPVAALYGDPEKAETWPMGSVIHVAQRVALLEAEMTTWVPGRGKSPNRVDALVFAVTKLLGLKTGRGGLRR